MKNLKHNRPVMLDVLGPNFMNRMFNDVWRNMDEEFVPQMAEFKPGSEILKTDTGYQVRVSLPGVKKEDMKVDMEGNVLTLSGERKNEHIENKNNVVRSEISYGKFSRSFTLSNDIERSKITADYKDGILTIDLPTAEKSHAQAIEIK